jgi:hypothetical protein
MNSTEDTRVPLMGPIEADSQPVVEHGDSYNVAILPSTTTVTIPSHVSENFDLQQAIINKQKADDKLDLFNLSRRLAIRKNLHDRL